MQAAESLQECEADKALAEERLSAVQQQHAALTDAHTQALADAEARQAKAEASTEPVPPQGCSLEELRHLKLAVKNAQVSLVTMRASVTAEVQVWHCVVCSTQQRARVHHRIHVVFSTSMLCALATSLVNGVACVPNRAVHLYRRIALAHI